jgi:hypothetical protein
MGRCTYVRPAASPSVVICCRSASQSYRDPLQRQPIRVEERLAGGDASGVSAQSAVNPKNILISVFGFVSNCIGLTVGLP